MMLVRSSLTNPNLLHNVTQIIEMRWWLDIFELLSSQVMIDWNPMSFNKALIVNLDSSSKNKSHLVVSDSLWPHGLSSPWNSPGENTGAGSLSLLQGIFPTQGSNPGLLHCRRILDQLSYKGNPQGTAVETRGNDALYWAPAESWMQSICLLFYATTL